MHHFKRHKEWGGRNTCRSSQQMACLYEQSGSVKCTISAPLHDRARNCEGSSCRVMSKMLTWQLELATSDLLLQLGPALGIEGWHASQHLIK